MGPQLADQIAQGLVKIEVLQFPLSAESMFAAEAVECAGDQGYWWAMHDKILNNQAQGTSSRLMKAYAEEMGLDTKAFNQCMDSDKYVSKIKAEANLGKKLGVSGTPTFYINGRPLSLRSFNDVATAVNKELSK